MRLRDRGGTDVVVVSRGRRNDAAGPDFLDAVLLIGGKLSIGSVEMHRDERDWFNHGHHHDPNYSTVILHVVGNASASPLLPGLSTVIASSIASMPEQFILGERQLEISRSLLVECAWARLLRRATEVMRSGESEDVVEHHRRAFLRRLFDALGYAANRSPMRLLIASVLNERGIESIPHFEDAASLLFGMGGCDERVVREHASMFIDECIVERILARRPQQQPGILWNRSTRPANIPERRLWGAARLLVDVAHGRMLESLFDRIEAGAHWNTIAHDVSVRHGSNAFIGHARASEIVMNALLPVTLAAGIAGGSSRLVHGACHAYRTAPAQQSNSTVRRIEARYLAGRVLTAGFWQQGAIELHQRYFSPDRSGLTFVADPEVHMGIRRPYCVS